MSKVFGMHKIELKPGVNETQFENFICGEVLPIYNKVPGQTVHLLKGDQGERDGKYLVLVEIESPERRDQIYPPPEGNFSEEVQELVGDVDSIWEKFDTFIEQFPDPTFTDYVMVSD